MSESGLGGNMEGVARDKALVLAAMMEELGVGRKDKLYLNDKGPRIPRANIETAAAKPVNPSDSIASHWNNVEFDDIDEADKLLDPIAHGQLYRQKQAIINDQSRAPFAGQTSNSQQYGGSGNRGHRSGRGGHGRTGRDGHSHIGERAGHKSPLGKVSGASISDQCPRPSAYEARGRADKSAHIGKCISRLRKQPSQTQKHPVHSQRSRARELPAIPFALATSEQFFTYHAKQNFIQRASNPSSVPDSANQPQVTASTSYTKANTSSDNVIKLSTNANSPSKDVSSPTNVLPKAGLAASIWAPSNSSTSTKNNTSSSKAPVKDPDTPSITLLKEGLAASRWAPPNDAADLSSNISCSESAVKRKVQPNVKADTRLTIALPKDGLAASRWAPSNQGKLSAFKTPHLEPPMKGHIQSKGKGAENDVFVAKPAVGLQGSNGDASRKPDVISSKPSVKAKVVGDLETFQQKISTLGDSSTLMLAAGMHNQMADGLLSSDAAQIENEIEMQMLVAPAPVPPASMAPPTSTVSELIPTSPQSPDISRSGNVTARSLLYADRISCATFSDLSVLEGGKKLITFGDSDEVEEHQEPEQHGQVHVMLSALFDLAEMNDQYVVESYFKRIDEYYGSFLTQLFNDVGHQNFGVDAPTDGLLSSEKYLEASERLVRSFFKNSETVKQLATLEVDMYIKDLSCKVFAKALAPRYDSTSSASQLIDFNLRITNSENQSVNTVNQVSEGVSFENPILSAARTQPNATRSEKFLPASIAPNSEAATPPTDTRYKYTIADLLQMCGQALVIKGELLSKSEIRGQNPHGPKNVLGYTASGVPTVAGRKEDREVTHSAPRFKPFSSASDWQAFANFNATARRGAVPSSNPGPGNSLTEHPPLFLYENSTSAFESYSHKSLEGASLTPSSPASVFKPTAIVDGFQSIFNSGHDAQADNIAQKQLPRSPTLASAGNSIAAPSRPDQPNKSLEIDVQKPLKSTISSKCLPQDTKSSNGPPLADSEIANVKTPSNLIVETQLLSRVTGPTAQSIVSPQKEGTAPQVSVLNDSIEASVAEKSQFKTGGARHAPSNSTDEKLAKAFGGLNLYADRRPIGTSATATPSKDSGNVSASASVGVAFMGSGTGATGGMRHYNPQSPQKALKQQKNSKVQSKQSSLPLNAMAAEYKSPLPTKLVSLDQQNKPMDSKGAPRLAASTWSSKNPNTDLTPKQQPPLRKTGTWRIFDAQSGKMIDIVGEVVNVIDPLKVAAPPMPTRPFSNQENIPIFSGEAPETVGTKANATIADTNDNFSPRPY